MDIFASFKWPRRRKNAINSLVDEIEEEKNRKIIKRDQIYKSDPLDVKIAEERITQKTSPIFSSF